MENRNYKWQDKRVFKVTLDTKSLKFDWIDICTKISKSEHLGIIDVNVNK